MRPEDLAGLPNYGGIYFDPATGTPEEQRWAWIRERMEKVRVGSSDKPARDAAVGYASSGSCSQT